MEESEKEEAAIEPEPKKTPDRRSDIDMLKAFCIICMIMGHVEFTEGFNKWIHGFHMPAFFIISGYLHKVRPVSEVAKRRFGTLIVPYLFFGALCVAVEFITEGVDLQVLKRFLLFNTQGEGVPMAGAIWFLTCMFFIEIFYAMAEAASKGNKKILTMIVLLMSLAGIIIVLFVSAKLIWAMDTALVGTGLYHMGRIVRLKGEKFIAMPLWATALSLILFSATIMFNDYVNMRKDDYGNFALFWINALGMSLALWSAFGLISKKFKLRLFADVGRYSIIYLCLNQLVIHFVKDAVVLAGINYYASPSVTFMCSVGVTIITMIVLYLFVLLFKHTPLRHIVGWK